jgi:transcription initiation factor TFIIH subunit 1
MAVPQGKAAYKKKDGILTLSGDQKTVTWTPLPGNGPPVVAITIANITSEQPSYRSVDCSLMLTLICRSPADAG